MMKSSWADRVEFEQGDLPEPSERIDGSLKIITDYREKDGKKFKVISTYKMEKKEVAKSVAHRKSLKKFGDSKNDSAGPNPATTIVAEEIFMQFVSIRGGVEEQQETEEDLQLQAKTQLSKVVACRICKEDHWTTHCPYKNQMPSNTPLDESSRAAAAAANAASKTSDSKVERYVSPGLRDGFGGRRGESMPLTRQNRDEATVRVTNLSEDVKDSDLTELFKPFGRITRIFLAKDKITNVPKGFAFVSYERISEAQNAINHVHGYGYDNLILSVEMANKSNN
ncbi:eukaryotic translation initiation factor 3 subunit G [Galendromus occidentalis]|uniref:Eukaryotic translation initiation factor 3 subunit G n=1 Tax=Galendromus occidentalis TaxID=34638 RepID=A0AAJ6W0K6_9ACAR|nr:eukaryotic translation initiation factor 3 subunit G [Galendromus occidentalis]